MSTENTEQNESIEQTGNKKLTKNGKIVLGVILSLVLIAAILLIVLVLVPEVKEERERRIYESLQFVEIRVIHPNTGEYLKDGDTIVVSEERTKIQVEFYDLETGERITEIPGNRFEDCYTSSVSYYRGGMLNLMPNTYWPRSSDISFMTENFHLRVTFEPYPYGSSVKEEDMRYKHTVLSMDINFINSN